MIKFWSSGKEIIEDDGVFRKRDIAGSLIALINICITIFLVVMGILTIVK